jgi:membrane fusion protein (multidrug efflux system)
VAQKFEHKVQEESRKKSFWGPVLTVFLAALALAGLVFWKMTASNAPSGGPMAGPGGPGKSMPQKVTGYIVGAERVTQNLEASGTFLAWNEVQLIPEVSGRIEVLNLREGSNVEKGEMLLVLFNEDIKAQIRKQELQLGMAKKNLSRLQDLLKINGVSQQEVDNAENQINNIQSDLKIYEANLRKTQLLAPFSGTIGFTNASLGAYINPGNPVASLQQFNPLKLEFSIPEKYLGLVSLGKKVSFLIENHADTLTAEIYAFDPKIDPGSRTLKIRARYENSKGRFLPGLFARVFLALDATENNLMVPTQSIIPETRGKKVVKYHNGKAEMLMVETGLRNADKVQIIKGLEIGDTILTSGLMFVKPQSDLILTRIEGKN